MGGIAYLGQWNTTAQSRCSLFTDELCVRPTKMDTELPLTDRRTLAAITEHPQFPRGSFSSYKRTSWRGSLRQYLDAIAIDVYRRSRLIIKSRYNFFDKVWYDLHEQLNIKTYYKKCIDVTTSQFIYLTLNNSTSRVNWIITKLIWNWWWS